MDGLELKYALEFTAYILVIQVIEFLTWDYIFTRMQAKRFNRKMKLVMILVTIINNQKQYI